MRCYAVIGIEDLAIANMTRSAKGTTAKPGANVQAKAGLNRSILEVGWAGCAKSFEYKSVRDGAVIVPVAPAGTSQTCSVCSYRAAENRRSQAVFVRPMWASRKCRHQCRRSHTRQSIGATGSPAQPEDAGLPFGRASWARA